MRSKIKRKKIKIKRIEIIYEKNIKITLCISFESMESGIGIVAK